MDSLSSLTGNKIALLIDFDNVILGVDDPGFDVEIVVNALRSRGNVVMGRAYGDWYRHHRHRRKLMEQGIELVETPVFGPLIKNSADIRIVLDGFEIAMSQPHINTFCLVSGDSDFLPLIKKLQYLGKHVIVIAGIKFTSDLIRRNCNEYISYENLFAESVGATEDVSVIEGAYVLLERAINTLNERIMDVRSSSVKQMMMQLNPAFSERTFGCSQFKQFLERAARDNRVTLEARDGSAGEMSVYWRDDAPRPEARPLPPSVSRASVHALRSPDRQSDRQNDRNDRPSPGTRDLTTARRSGRKFSGRAGGVQSDTAVPAGTETEVPPLDAQSIIGDVVVDTTPALVTPERAQKFGADSLSEDDFAAVAPPAGGFVNNLAKRSDLRPGRLRFSAKTGTVPAKPPVLPVSPTPAEILLESDKELAASYPDVAAAPRAEASIQQTGDAAAIAEALEASAENAPKKRATRRGGRTRKKKDGEAPETAAAPAAEAAPAPEPPAPAVVEAPVPAAEPAPAAARPARRPSRSKKAAPAAAQEAAAPEPANDTNSLFPIDTPPTEASAPDAASGEPAAKKPTRARRGGTARTAARKKKDDGGPPEAA